MTRMLLLFHICAVDLLAPEERRIWERNAEAHEEASEAVAGPVKAAGWAFIVGINLTFAYYVLQFGASRVRRAAASASLP
jgi:hypothetical protein